MEATLTIVVARVPAVVADMVTVAEVELVEVVEVDPCQLPEGRCLGREQVLSTLTAVEYLKQVMEEQCLEWEPVLPTLVAVAYLSLAKLLPLERAVTLRPFACARELGVPNRPT